MFSCRAYRTSSVLSNNMKTILSLCKLRTLYFFEGPDSYTNKNTIFLVTRQLARKQHITQNDFSPLGESVQAIYQLNFFFYFCVSQLYAYNITQKHIYLLGHAHAQHCIIHRIKLISVILHQYNSFKTFICCLHYFVSTNGV